ncbi:MAG: exosortase/archaeosortase family protein [Chloroflexi bacterium]|nr:exosortase/archaeosortase family protein [Chloroflexota bacterium]
MDRKTLSEIQSTPVRPGQNTYQLILLLAAAVLMVLPLVTTFNEFLTRMVINLNLNWILEDWVVPSEVRMIAVLLRPFGISAMVNDEALFLSKPGSAFPIPVYISWNCVGWQSFILFAITLVSGLQGPFSRARKIQVIALGLLGTFWMNLLRIAAVALVAYYFGRLPAVIFHDYGGTLMILIWLTVLWSVLFNYFLEREYEWVPEASRANGSFSQ